MFVREIQQNYTFERVISSEFKFRIQKSIVVWQLKSELDVGQQN